jgi:hypothetical protein
VIPLGGGFFQPLGLDHPVQRCDILVDGSAEICGTITGIGRQPFQGLSEIVCGLFPARWCCGIGGPQGGINGIKAFPSPQFGLDIKAFPRLAFGLEAAPSGGQPFGVSAFPCCRRRALDLIRPFKTIRFAAV